MPSASKKVCQVQYLHSFELSTSRIEKMIQYGITFSDIGGIYCCHDIKTKYHTHQAITIAISFEEKFILSYDDKEVKTQAAIIQPNTRRKIQIDKTKLMVFIHIEPFTLTGLKVLDLKNKIRFLKIEEISNILKLLSQFSKRDPSEIEKQQLIEKIVSQIQPISLKITIDKRVFDSAKIIMNRHSNYTLDEISSKFGLSRYRFSHLFKAQTGVNLRQYLLYQKLIRALKTLASNDHNLTQVAYGGGFSDQAHFTRTFVKAFGVLPSKI